VTTNDIDPVGSTYASHTEYWSMAPMSVERNGPLAMEASQKELTAEEITDFLLPSTGWGPVVSVAQVIGTGGWTQGTYVPTGAQKRLFKAVDPDDSASFDTATGARSPGERSPIPRRTTSSSDSC
jgi:hypothetical protein